MNNVFRYLKKQLPNILTAMSMCGVVATAYLASKATKDAEERIFESTNDMDKFSNLDLVTKVRITYPAYIPTAITALSTIGCILGANILDRRHQADITSAYIMLDQAFRKYRNKVIELEGADIDRNIRSNIVKDRYRDEKCSHSDDGMLIFYEEHYGKFFERHMSEVIDAQYQLNRKFAIDGEASVNDFLQYLGLEGVPGGNTIGWTIEDDYFTYPWLDFDHELVILEDGMECHSIVCQKHAVSLLPF